MRCQATYMDNWSEIQCTRTATVDGRWCRQHSPEAKAARQAATTAAWEAKQSAHVRDIHRLALHDDLVAALEGLVGWQHGATHESAWQEAQKQARDVLKRAKEVE